MYQRYIMFFLTLLFFYKETSCLYTYSKDEWRFVNNAGLSATHISVNSDVDHDSIPKCQSKCAENENCLSFKFTSNDNSCYMYDTRFGFNETFLQTLSQTIYYEKPIGYNENNIDTIGRYLYYNQERDNGDMSTYLSRFRNGIQGIVNTNDTINGNSQEFLELTNIMDAYDCAANCLRNGGNIGTGYSRCNSFNYNPNSRICQLLSFGLDNEHTIKISGSDGFKYYDRIMGLPGSGCWISQSACKSQNSNGTNKYVGHFKHTKTLLLSNGDNFNIPNGIIQWESDCVEMAQWWHEDKCQNDVSVTTIASWYGDGLTPSYIDWNSFDLSFGCVITIPSDCVGGNERFHFEQFRDSIGEEYYAAAETSLKCFDRAEEYHDYVCEGDTNKTIRLDFPKTDQYYIFPTPNCKCDEYGLKIDTESNNIKYCSRKNPDELCYRSTQGNYWEYRDVLCDDVVGGCNPYQNSTSTNCFYIRAYDDGIQPCSNDAFRFNALTHYIIPIEGTFTLQECKDEAQNAYLNVCENSIDMGISNQIKTWYPSTGDVSLYPNFIQPYTTTLIRGLDTDAKFVINNPDSRLISLMPIRTGRWMSFTAQSNAFLRAIDVWIHTPYAISLTLTLYRGKGITDVETLTSITQTVPQTTTDLHSTRYELGSFINFVFPNDNFWEIESGIIYTWEITIVENTGTEDVSIGYDLGDNSYSLGEGDLTWDYLFITWIEQFQQKGSLVQFNIAQNDKRPWFEAWFITGLILWIMFLGLLLFLTWQKRKQEKKDKEEDRQYQRQLKEKIRQQQEQEQINKSIKKQKRNNNNNNTNDIALNNDDVKEDIDSESDNDDINGGVNDTNNGRTKNLK